MIITFLLICGCFCGIYFIDAGLVWLICNLLTSIGFTTIGNWNIKFSWTLVLIVLLLQLLFSPSTSITNNYKKW